MHTDPVLDRMGSELITQHAAHTLVLYGSRADGSSGPDSDYDVAAFAPVSNTVRVARQVDGDYWDVFVYPEALLLDPPEELLRLRAGRVIRQRMTQGDDLLRKLEQRFAQGPAPLAQDEAEARRVWARKMADRATRGDLEGNYRRVWLLTALLEDYFHLRGLWYQGPKKALRWLEQFDAPTGAAMRLALEPASGAEAILMLVERVAGNTPSA